MKHLFHFLLLIPIVTSNLFGQLTKTINLNPDVDGYIKSHNGGGWEYVATTDFSTSVELAAERTSSYGESVTRRGLIGFNLNSAARPQGYEYNSAKLSLYSGNGTNINNTTYTNACYLRRITSSWKIPGEIAWNYIVASDGTTPVSEVNELFIDATNEATRDLLNLDVTNLVNDMFDDPLDQQGFMLMLANDNNSSNTTRRQSFASKEFDALSKPTLKVEYKLKEGAGIERPIDKGVLNTGEVVNWACNTAPENNFGNLYTGLNNQPSNDVFYKFRVSSPTAVQIRTTSTVGETWFHLLDENKQHIQTNYVNQHDYLYGQLQQGMDYYLAAENINDNILHGDFTSQLKLAKQGDLWNWPIEIIYNPTEGIIYPVTHSTSTFNNFYDVINNQPSPEVCYSFILTKREQVKIWHENQSGLSSTHLYLLTSNGHMLSHGANNGTGNTELNIDLDPGTYIIVSEGHGTSAGSITTKLQVSVPSGSTDDKPFKLGAVTLNNMFTHNVNINANSNLSDQYGQNSQDIFYEFEITEPSRVNVFTTKTSGEQHFYLLDQHQQQIAATWTTSYDDKIIKNISPGKYYIVSEFADQSITGEMETKLLTTCKGATVDYPIFLSDIDDYGKHYFSCTNSDRFGNHLIFANQLSNDVIYKFKSNKSGKLTIDLKAGPGLAAARLYLFYPDIQSPLITLQSLENSLTTQQVDISPGYYMIAVEGILDYQGEIDFSLQLEVPVFPLTEARNWTRTITYTSNGQIAGQSVNYYNDLGKPIQTVSQNISRNKAIVSQIVYDEQGRAALTTLPAEVDQQSMNFVKWFITSGSYDYDYFNYSGDNKYNPDPVDNTCPLGYYYSSANTAQPFIDDAQGYPFIVTDYSEIRPNIARKSSGAGLANQLGDNDQMNTHLPQSHVLPASYSELGLIDEAVSLGLEYKNLIKSVTRNGEGKEVITYSTSDGRSVSSCIAGTGVSKYCFYHFGNFGYIDIHLPLVESIPVDYTLTKVPVGSLGTGWQAEIYSLEDDSDIETWLASDASLLLKSGFYRIKFITKLPSHEIYNLYVFYTALKTGEHSFNIYDKTKRLVRSFSPKGFDLYKADPTRLDELSTTYKYDQHGNIKEISSPDEGVSKFIYLVDGRIKYSQNAKQKSTSYISFTDYDDAGRIIAAGEYKIGSLSLTDLPVEQVISESQTNIRQVNYTMYDLQDLGTGTAENPTFKFITQNYDIPYYSQRFVAGNVSRTNNDNCYTWYSYRYDGLVDWIVTYIKEFGVKTLEYTYDFNGQVTKVTYQKNAPDQFEHIYNYDADGRLSIVYTKTKDGELREQAQYYYYPHGPLKRVELAENLQGIDYVYNINGLLKGINHPSLNADNDPGRDGKNGQHWNFKYDLFGMILDYNSTDYSKENSFDNSMFAYNGPSLYDGNISAQKWAVKTVDENKIHTYTYGYNQKGYFTSADKGSVDITNNSYFNGADYDVSNITYDLNGNILTLNRNGYRLDHNDLMDKLTYNYSNNLNQLVRVTDDMSNDMSNIDFDNMDHDFEYNDIGQLISDGEFDYEYDVYGKVTKVLKNSYLHARYEYDERGFRIRKRVYTEDQDLTDDYYATSQITTYIRDLSGNIISTYKQQGEYVHNRNSGHWLDNILSTAKIEETPIYGSSRIGMANYDQDGSLYKYLYEITDHLGNVRVTFDDNFENGDQLTTFADYYPFGMKMPDRQGQSQEYRFGYQGQYSEKDPETGYNQFEARLYDPRIGRWMIPDPAHQFHSPYLAMGNNPVYYVDEDGEFVQLITAGIGAVINTGITLYSMSKEAGGFKNIDWNLQAGVRLGSAFATGALAGSGLGGLAGGVAASLLGNGADQVIRNDFSFNNFDLVEFGASGLGAWAGGKLGTAAVSNKWVSSLINANFSQGFANQLLREGMAGTIGSFAGWQSGLWSTEAIHGLIDVFKDQTLIPGFVKDNGGAVFMEDVNKIINKKNPSNYVTFPIAPVQVTPN